MKTIGLLAGATILSVIAGPAAASTVVTTACVNVAHADGCLFTGNINGNTNPANANSYLNAQNAYNAVRDADIALIYLSDTDNAGFGSFGSFTGAGTSSGTWSLPGYDVRYIAVKASPGFVLYEVSGSSGNWDTLDIPYLNSQGRGNPHAISHLAFFGSLAVPEPSAWALMILGFGVAGAAMRRRRTQVRYA